MLSTIKNIFFIYMIIYILLKLLAIMSIITSSRLVNFFYFINSNTLFSPFLVKYVIKKYCEAEASEEVIKALLDKKNLCNKDS